MISPFTLTRLPKILFGVGRIAEVPTLLEEYGRNVLVVSGSETFLASEQWSALKEAAAECGLAREMVRVKGEPSPDFVDNVVAEYRDRKIDVVLGIGGGSAIDAAKAVAALLPFGNSVMDHLEGVGKGVPYRGPSLPCVAVPTTAGTGSETTKNAVLSARGKNGFKRSFRHDALMPAAAVVDPALTYTCPPELWASVGMDAVTQLIEAYTSKGANEFTDALALSGLTVAKDGLEAAWRGSQQGSGAMSYAAMLSGIALAHAGLGVVHGLASPLGALFPIPHGAACAALLAPAIEINIRAMRERDPRNPALTKYIKLGLLMSHVTPTSPETACESLIRKISEWNRTFNIAGLGNFGVAEKDLKSIAAACRAKTNPVTLTLDETVEILRAGL